MAKDRKFHDFLCRITKREIVGSPLSLSHGPSEDVFPPFNCPIMCCLPIYLEECFIYLKNHIKSFTFITREFSCPFVSPGSLKTDSKLCCIKHNKNIHIFKFKDNFIENVEGFKMFQIKDNCIFK